MAADVAVNVAAEGGITLASVVSHEIGVVFGYSEIGVSAQLLSANASDSLLLLVLLDSDGEPILDVNGQYIVGG